MKIYFIRAQAPHRVLALVKHLGIKAELVEMNPVAREMKQPAYLALNPNGKAPTLVDGDFVLWEAGAIMAHLCIQAKSDMWPANNPAEQVQVLRWMSWGEAHWTAPVSAFYFEHVIKAKFSMGPPDVALLDKTRKALGAMATILNGELAGKDFLACDRLTIADFQLASMACHWREADMQLEPYPNVVHWLDNLQRIPAWADPWPPVAAE